MAPTFETADNDKKSPAFPNLFLPLTIQPEGNLDDKKFRKETHPSDVSNNERLLPHTVLFHQ
jgi:hypothetical protein